MEAQLDNLAKVVEIFAAAVIIVAVFRKLKLSPVLGYLVAGAAVGSSGLNYIAFGDVKEIANFGIVFLMFMIGLELTLERVASMSKLIFGVGSIQLIVTSFVIGAIGYYFFSRIGVKESLIIGGGLALSSTAVVLRVIADADQQYSKVGRLSLAVLLMQDFAVVPLLVLTSLFGSHHEESIYLAVGNAMFKTLVVMVSIFLTGRIVLRPIFKVVASLKSDELFSATTLLIVLGTSYATEAMGISLELGAFIAGLLVAETKYQHRVEETVKPFRDLLLGLFFMSVGMTIDPALITSELFTIVWLSAALMGTKSLVIVLIGLVSRIPLGTALHTGLLLSQGGEFAFILFGYATEVKLIDSVDSQILLMVVTVTMALTPLLWILGSKLAKLIDGEVKAGQMSFSDVSELEKHVIICGLGRTGKMVARLLDAEKVNYIGLDVDLKVVRAARKDGYPVLHADTGKMESLRMVSLDRAEALVLTLDNSVTIERMIRMVRKLYKDIPIIVRDIDTHRAAELRSAGATVLVPEAYEAGLQLGGAVLRSIGVNSEEVSRIKNVFRESGYARIEEQEKEESSHQKKEASATT